VLSLDATHAPASDAATAGRDLQSSDDFRLRVSAALTLGRTHAPDALELLTGALGDSHPAVRIAAAAALGALDDPAALPALRRALGSERSAGVRSQISSTIARLSAQAPPAPNPEARWQSTRYVVAIGNMHNRSQVPGTHSSDVLRTATKTHAQSIPGALVSEGDDTALFDQAAARHVPIFVLDGSLQKLNQKQKASELSYNATVNYSLRKVPQHELRGMLSGSATSFGSVNALRSPGTMTQLADQAIEGAVESALRGAAQGLGEASR
jgi:hypothetical protein